MCFEYKSTRVPGKNFGLKFIVNIFVILVLSRLLFQICKETKFMNGDTKDQIFQLIGGGARRRPRKRPAPKSSKRLFKNWLWENNFMCA